MGKRLFAGIDLGERSVKLAVVDASGKQPKLVAADVEPIERSDAASSEAAPGRVRAWQRAIESLLNRGAVRPRALDRVSLGVSGDSVTVRQFDLPILSDRELASSMPHESRRHVPLPPETEIALSYQVLTRDTAKERMEILLGACPKRLVRDAVGSAEAAGLECEIVDVAPLAALNAIIHAHDPDAARGDFAFLDVGGTGSTLTLYKRDEFLLCRRIALGGDAMTSEMARKLGVSFEEAERGKCANADSRGATRISLIQETIAQLGSEITTTMSFFANKTGAESAEALAIGGGGSHTPGLAEVLEGMIGRPVRHVAPLAAFAIQRPPGGPHGGARADADSEFAVALGLTRWWQS
ncbi:MAG: pilus assembly protein PilM [bacterium]